MPFSKNDHVVQAVSSNGSDQPLHIRPLPGAGRGGEGLLHTQTSNSLPKLLAIDFVPVAQQVTACGIFRKGFDYLLPGPQRRRLLRHIEVQHTSAVMSQHHQDKQDSKRGGGAVKKSIEINSFRWLAKKALQL